MTVFEFCNLATDDGVQVAIYDMNKDVEVFRGEMREALYGDYSDHEVWSFDFDNRGVIILNIDTNID